MLARVLSAVLLAPLAIAAVLGLPTAALGALAAPLLLLALWEWISLTGVTALPTRRLVLLANAAAIALLALFGWPLLASPVILAGVLWWLVAGYWTWRWRRRALAELADVRIRRKLMAGSFAVIPAWAALVALHGDSDLGPRWALFALCLVWLTDIGGFLVGSRFGHRRLAPQISPNKTWEGLWGGFAAALLGAVAALPMLGLDWSHLPTLLVLAAVTAGFAVLGDLFESLLKRVAGIKDSGQVIPGHGGMLDRVDSLLAALPVFAALRWGLGL